MDGLTLPAVLVEEGLAGIAAGLPALDIEIAVPDLPFFDGLLGRFETIGHVIVEERAGGEHQHLALEAQGCGTGHAALPGDLIAAGQRPGQRRCGGGLVEQVNDELHGLLHGTPRTVLVDHRHVLGMVDQRQTSEVAEHVEITRCHHDLGLGDQPLLLLLRHVGHPVDVFDEDPGIAYALPDPSLGKGELASVGVVVFVLHGVDPRIIGRTGRIVSDGAVVAVGESIQMAAVEPVGGPGHPFVEGHVHVRVDVPEKIARIFSLGEDLVDVDVHTGRLVQEIVPELDLLRTAASPKGRQQQRAKSEYMLFHG